jgi:hypothetical protein
VQWLKKHGKGYQPASTPSSAPTWKPNPTTPANPVPNPCHSERGRRPGEESALCSHGKCSCVERTLLSAGFDLDFVFELKDHVPLGTTVEERRFQRRVTRTEQKQSFTPEIRVRAR